MITELLKADALTEPVVRFAVKIPRSQSPRAWAVDLIGGVVVIAGFVGLFFAIRLGLALGVQAILHEIADHVRVSGGF